MLHFAKCQPAESSVFPSVLGGEGRGRRAMWVHSDDRNGERAIERKGHGERSAYFATGERGETAKVVNRGEF